MTPAATGTADTPVTAGATAAPATTEGSVLHVRNGGLSFGERTLWHSLDLSLAAGEFVAVLGSNGTGKSSLLKAILGLQPLSEGTVEVGGAPARRGSGLIGYIPQERRIDPPVPLRARDLIALAVDGRGSKRRRQAASAALEQVGAAELADVPLQRMSGGEQQRVRIAQALATDPVLLLCDEPLLSLDLAYQELVVGLIDQRRRAHDTGVLFVTHEINPVLPFVDRVLYLANGQFSIGSVDEVMTSSNLSSLYRTHVEVIRTGGRILVAGQGFTEQEHHL